MSVVVGGLIVIGAGGAVVGYTACMFQCMGGDSPERCQKTNPGDTGWNKRFARCTKICVTPTMIWQFLIDPYGSSATTALQSTSK